ILKMSEDKLWNTFFCKESLLLKILADTPFKFVQTTDALSQTDATLTLCEKLLYRSGSIVVTNIKQPRTAIIQSQIHIVVAYTSQLKNDMKDAFNELKQQNGGKMPKWFSMISGLSYTNQIESNKIEGVHGAKELYCFLIEDRKADFLNKLFEE
ncbi:MAG: LUD domain-containing protein, partial [Bacteroidetes bacterium]|nr:LUD domain-containing protein [Bacteroidota bacterium]